MKAISIKQPWASLIVHGIKNIENRSWKCPEKYIGGRILIHASKNNLLENKAPYLYLTTYQEYEIDNNKAFKSWFLGQWNYGEIIGSVEIMDCVINHSSVWAEKYPTYNWILANPILFPNPIPAKGKLSFWDYPQISSEMGDFGHDICMCQLSVDEEDQVMDLGDGDYRCRYCGGIWYK